MVSPGPFPPEGKRVGSGPRPKEFPGTVGLQGRGFRVLGQLLISGGPVPFPSLLVTEVVIQWVVAAANVVYL